MDTESEVRVLHIISGLGVGGAERLLLWAARYHDRERYPMGIISLMSGGELAPEIRATGVPLVELGQKKGRLTPQGFRDFLTQVRRFRPQILQGHMFHSNVLVRIARPLALKAGLVVNTIHGESEPLHRRVIDNATARFSDGFLTFSPHIGEVLSRGRGNLRLVRYIPYGIEIPAGPKIQKSAPREALGLGENLFLWISVGRLVRIKGFQDLIEAFFLLKRRVGETVLLIAGEGEQRPLIEKIIRDKGLNDCVFLLGARGDISDLLNASDAFVSSSRSEAGPLVLLEAMAASLPVVATRVGAVPTMAVEGKTALLVQPRRPDLLAEAMERLMQMGKEGRRMGEAGRVRLEKFYDFRLMQREVEKFYGELTAGSGGVSL